MEEKLQEVEFSIEAAQRGLEAVREGGSPEPVIQNLMRAIQEVQDATRDPHVLASARA